MKEGLVLPLWDSYNGSFPNLLLYPIGVDDAIGVQSTMEDTAKRCG